MSQALVLIVDDDAELSGMLCELFAREGWATHTVLTVGDGERAVVERKPDAVLLDVMLPDGNGLDTCRRWRAQHPGLGILMLTARGDPLDRALGLELGADDYLPKPFEPRELVARVRALLRRQVPQRAETAVLRYAGLTIDLLQRQVLASGGAGGPGPAGPDGLTQKTVSLTSVEFKLLVALARAPGQALTRDQLCETVQTGNYRPQDRTVDVQVARLRRKLRDASPGTEWIDTVRGEGYVFVPRHA